MVSFTIVLLSTLLIALLAAGIYVVIKVRRDQPRTRAVVRVRHVIGPTFLVVAVIAIGVTPLGTLSFDMEYEVASSPGEDAIPVDEGTTDTFEVPIEPLPGTTYVVRSEGVSVERWVVEEETMRVTVRIPPAVEPGAYSATLQVTPYLRVLPGGLLEELHDRHPVVAMLGTAATLVLPFYLLVRLLFDGDRPLYRPRRRWIRRRLGDRL